MTELERLQYLKASMIEYLVSAVDQYVSECVRSIRTPEVLTGDSFDKSREVQERIRLLNMLASDVRYALASAEKELLFSETQAQALDLKKVKQNA